MKRNIFGSPSLRNSILLVSVVFAVFVLPVMPGVWHRSLFRLVYTVIYISAILSLEKRNNYLLILFFSTMFIEWVSAIMNLSILLILAKMVNIIFFFVIVGSLIKQISTARKVSAGIILSSVAGYLLLGLIFSIITIFIMDNDPDAFSSPPKLNAESEESINASVPIYYSFVTLATLGYGDIIPLKPYTRSIATLITVTGQLYIAIIVALLVGKFSSQTGVFTDE